MRISRGEAEEVTEGVPQSETGKVAGVPQGVASKVAAGAVLGVRDRCPTLECCSA